MEVADRISTDAFIVGAGPAGSTLAALLAGAGVSVVIADKSKFPRDKVCGEFLSYDALPLLDFLGVTPLLDDAGATRISSCRVIGSTTTYEFSLPRAARGVSRLLLDDTLLRTAASKGAQALPGWEVIRIDPGRDSSSITLRNGDRTIVVSARVVAGAWGRWGRFDRQLERSFATDRRHRHFGFKRHYRAIAPRPADSIDLHSFDRGYLGVSSIEGGLTNICGLVHRTRIEKMKGGWETFISTLQRERSSLDDLYRSHEPAQDEFLSSEPVIFTARSPVERGIFMVGDAAGIIDPLTGNGMAMAIQSALAAAPAVLRRLTAPEPARIVENEYRAAFRKMFGSRLFWSRRIAFLLSRPGLLDQAMRVTSSPSVGRILLGRTRADYETVESWVGAWASRLAAGRRA